MADEFVQVGWISAFDRDAFNQGEVGVFTHKPETADAVPVYMRAGDLPEASEEPT